MIQKPYENGKVEDYFLEVYERGEKDSAKQSDSLFFTTPKGNIVYGGGGITPDFLVPTDTRLSSNKLSVIFQ